MNIISNTYLTNETIIFLLCDRTLKEYKISVVLSYTRQKLYISYRNYMMVFN